MGHSHNNSLDNSRVTLSAAMQAANSGNAGPKKIDYHLKPKILGKEFTTSELRTWCSGMIFFWAAQLMETRKEGGPLG
jgi:hypothetical protein